MRTPPTASGPTFGHRSPSLPFRYYGAAPAVERPVRCADLGDGLRDAKRRIGRCEIEDITLAPWACNTHNSIDVFSFDSIDPFCLDVYTSQTCVR